MKKFFSILFSLLFAVCVFATLLLSVVRFNFSYSAITKIASEILKPVAKAPARQDGLFRPGSPVRVLCAYEGGDFDFSSLDLSSIDFSNLDVNGVVGQYLEAAGVDVKPEFISEVLASPDVSQFVDKYAGEIVGYITGATDTLSINPEDVKKVLNKSIDMYEKRTGETVDRSGMDEAIKENVAAAQTQITAALDEAKKENAEALSALKAVEFVLSLKFFLACIGVCAFFALVIFLINLNFFAWLQYVFMPVFIDGLLLFAAAVSAQSFLPPVLTAQFQGQNVPRGVCEGLLAYLEKVFGQMKIYGAVAAVAGLALFVVGTLCNKKKKAA